MSGELAFRLSSPAPLPVLALLFPDYTSMPTSSVLLSFGLLILLPFLRHQGETIRTLPHSSFVAG